jgi:hypothetical protein
MVEVRQRSRWILSRPISFSVQVGCIETPLPDWIKGGHNLERLRAYHHNWIRICDDKLMCCSFVGD